MNTLQFYQDIQVKEKIQINFRKRVTRMDTMFDN